MNIKRFFYAFSFLVISASVAIAQEKESAGVKYNFNYGWKLNVGDAANAETGAYDDQKWTAVNLPYAWNQAEAFKKDITQLSTGIAWYRKTFQLPKDSSDKKVFIEFEGVRQMGEVYLNGTFIGRHENGVMAFGFDLTPYVKPFPQENVIAVKTDNDWKYKEKVSGSGFQWNNNNFNANYGGLPKNVYLHIKSKVYQTLPLFSTLGTTGTYVYATDFNIAEKKAVVNVSSQVKNELSKPVNAQLKVSIVDIQGKEVASFLGDSFTVNPNEKKDLKASKALSNLNFWSWGYGYL
ncbi:MAG: beta galactosidase jelly roll domain-containing protein, partial [Flavobacterium sp.]|nr:beta galactosidase jelly roll domain-containing protein [Flavobacterium sp.]